MLIVKIDFARHAVIYAREQRGGQPCQRHETRAGIKTRIGNQTMRATGITDYLKSDGSLGEGLEDGESRRHANHAAIRPARG